MSRSETSRGSDDRGRRQSWCADSGWPPHHKWNVRCSRN